MVIYVQLWKRHLLKREEPLAAEGRPSGKQRLTDQSISSPLCQQLQIADSWLLFNSRAMLLGEKKKSRVLAESCNSETASDDHTQRSSNVASGKLVWNQLKCTFLIGSKIAQGDWMIYHARHICAMYMTCADINTCLRLRLIWYINLVYKSRVEAYSLISCRVFLNTDFSQTHKL